ncbi:MAG: DEAD/DEAH box helicase, partial [Pseudomonadota bacterium]
MTERLTHKRETKPEPEATETSISKFHFEPGFQPLTTRWLENTFDAATDIQRDGWQAIAERNHSLLIAPTGSGKTLAAFLVAIDRLVASPPPAGSGVGSRNGDGRWPQQGPQSHQEPSENAP